ncbi:hypothetical protein PAXRUDRAFT_114386, partial [Paxillus rubicundulus Ve08.2h10]
SWFQTHSPLIPPHPLAFGDNSTTSAIRMGTVTLFSTISGRRYKFVLTNVLLIPEFWISLISVYCPYPTIFPASSGMCYVWKGRTPVLTRTHQ